MTKKDENTQHFEIMDFPDKILAPRACNDMVAHSLILADTELASF